MLIVFHAPSRGERFICATYNKFRVRVFPELKSLDSIDLDALYRRAYRGEFDFYIPCPALTTTELHDYTWPCRFASLSERLDSAKMDAKVIKRITRHNPITVNVGITEGDSFRWPAGGTTNNAQSRSQPAKTFHFARERENGRSRCLALIELSLKRSSSRHREFRGELETRVFSLSFLYHSRSVRTGISHFN